MEIIDAIRADDTEERRQKVKEYVRMIQSPTPADVAVVRKIKAVMRDLGKSVDDLLADGKALTEIRRLRKLAPLADERQKALNAAAAAITAHEEEIRRVKLAMEADHRRLSAEHSRALLTYGEASQAEKRLPEMERVHWEILGLPPVATETAAPDRDGNAA